MIIFVFLVIFEKNIEIIVWISANCIFIRVSRIESGYVIEGRIIVTKEIQDNVIAIGNPFREIKVIKRS
jgi:acetyltransferase-like isoleucine patch superfamily enzyme